MNEYPTPQRYSPTCDLDDTTIDGRLEWMREMYVDTPDDQKPNWLFAAMTFYIDAHEAVRELRVDNQRLKDQVYGLLDMRHSSADARVMQCSDVVPQEAE